MKDKNSFVSNIIMQIKDLILFKLIMVATDYYDLLVRNLKCLSRMLFFVDEDDAELILNINNLSPDYVVSLKNEKENKLFLN